MDIKNEFFVEQDCPLCNSKGGQKLFSVDHQESDVLKLINAEEKNISADIIKCNKCPHIYMSPIISVDILNQYYSKINSEFYLRRDGEIRNLNVNEYINYTRKIQSKISHGSVLEIGCGNGYLLKTLSDGGFDCYGIEPSPLAYNHAKNVLKLNVDNCFLHESKFYDQQFDVIVMIDVVEHISEMNLFMQQITKVLKPGGFIFIGTGDINSLNARIGGANWGYFYTWEHVSFFNRASIKLLLEKFKFTEIEVRKTSLKHKPVENLIEFGKNIVKKVVNPFLKKKYYHGICFDHLIVMAKYNG